MFCEIVRHDGEAFPPDEVKLVFLDMIFYPVKRMSKDFESFWRMANVSIP